ncbi:hypothetical protein PNOK_0129400 [Pyrrhoderma noxium]|uniref:Uncharacterized protein n=1 Tax=Pyrrhoderma noxium TaxID=2282107 RepID=A0A286UXC2_9AGAM|nr:hypothetical protein PNOK_0129400 [Pyrrhoderma noxium]
MRLTWLALFLNFIGTGISWVDTLWIDCALCRWACVPIGILVHTFHGSRTLLLALFRGTVGLGMCIVFFIFYPNCIDKTVLTQPLTDLVQNRFYPSIPFDPNPLNKSGIDKIVFRSYDASFPAPVLFSLCRPCSLI